MAVITGRVLDVNTGNPVPGAHVSMDGRSARTDGTGRFTLTVQDRRYTLRVTARGYSAYKASITILGDGELTVDMVPVVPML